MRVIIGAFLGFLAGVAVFGLVNNLGAFASGAETMGDVPGGWEGVAGSAWLVLVVGIAGALLGALVASLFPGARRVVYIAAGLAIGTLLGWWANILVGDLGVAIRGVEMRGDLLPGWMVLRVLAHLAVASAGAFLGWWMSSEPPLVRRLVDGTRGLPRARLVPAPLGLLVAVVVGGGLVLLLLPLFPTPAYKWVTDRDSPFDSRPSPILPARIALDVQSVHYHEDDGVGTVRLENLSDGPVHCKVEASGSWFSRGERGNTWELSLAAGEVRIRSVHFERYFGLNVAPVCEWDRGAD